MLPDFGRGCPDIREHRHSHPRPVSGPDPRADEAPHGGAHRVRKAHAQPGTDTDTVVHVHAAGSR